MKADGTLDEIIKKWTGKANHQITITVQTLLLVKKATPKKSKYI